LHCAALGFLRRLRKRRFAGVGRRQPGLDRRGDHERSKGSLPADLHPGKGRFARRDLGDADQRRLDQADLRHVQTARLTRFGWVMAVAAAVRLPAFALAWEHYGDAPVRIELAERWARAPHLWRGFLETYQYGPLHLTLIGALVRLLGDRVAAARTLSLVCGLLGVALIWALARRIRSEDAAFWAGLGLALSPLHIQASTTGASEAPFLALLLGALI